MAKKKPTGKVVFLDKSARALLPFVSRDVTREILTAVHVTPDYCEATDSYRLVRITHRDQMTDPENYPRVAGRSVVSEVPASGVCIPAESIQKALAGIPKKKSLPVLEQVALEITDHYANLTTTDLEQTVTNQARLIEGTFPNVQQLIESFTPKDGDTSVTVAFNATFLKEVAAAVEKFGRNVPIEITLQDPLKPALIRAKNENGQTLTAILMSVRPG